ncbi:hypothetical protein P9112_009740 [Eukaryota sp. TZLM1-RC]
MSRSCPIHGSSEFTSLSCSHVFCNMCSRGHRSHCPICSPVTSLPGDEEIAMIRSPENHSNTLLRQQTEDMPSSQPLNWISKLKAIRDDQDTPDSLTKVEYNLYDNVSDTHQAISIEEVDFLYGPVECNTCILKGSFMNWDEGIPMERCDYDPTVFQTTLYLESSNTYDFKFVVDGEWHCCERYETRVDAQGNVNNFITIE